MKSSSQSRSHESRRDAISDLTYIGVRERANAFDKFRPINRVSRAAKGERVREWKNRWAKNGGRRGNRSMEGEGRRANRAATGRGW